MKKILSILMVIACLGMAMPAQAQIKFGLKGGLNITTLSFSEDAFKGDNRTGFFIGPMAELTIPVIGLGVDVAALYNQAKGKTDYYEEQASQDETLKSIEVPYGQHVGRIYRCRSSIWLQCRKRIVSNRLGNI